MMVLLATAEEVQQHGNNAVRNFAVKCFPFTAFQREGDRKQSELKGI